LRSNDRVSNNKEIQIYRTIVDLGKQANMLGTVSAKNNDEKRKFVIQGNNIIHKTMEIVQQKSCVDDYCRPEIANNYFRPLINLICYASYIAEIEGQFLDATLFNITLLKLGMIISDKG
jgi:hypothetical protein